MKFKNTNNIILLSSLFLGVFLFSTIVWAAFTTTLEINGSVSVVKQGWDIHFANLSSVNLSGDAIEASNPKIDSSATKISDYSIKFITPADSASYTFDIVNAGTFGAKLSTLTNGTKICTDGNGNTNSVDANNVCENIIYELKYTSTGANVSEFDTLKAGDKVNVTLTIKYSNDVTTEKLPSTEVLVGGLSTTLVYTQDTNVSETTGK